MEKILTNLEPFREQAKTVLTSEIEEFQEISFVTKGTVVVGFEFNKKPVYCFKQNHDCSIGAYDCTFEQRSRFIYTSLTYIEGYFIRKTKWLSALKMNPNINLRIR